MAIQLINKGGSIPGLIGLSTDTKPTTNMPAGSKFEEVDTGKKFMFYGTAWYPSFIETSLNGGLVNEPIRKTLVANTDTLFTFSALCKKFDIMNLGVGDIYYRIDAVAAVSGATSTLVPSAMGYQADIQGTVVHVISSGTPIVQIVGVR